MKTTRKNILLFTLVLLLSWLFSITTFAGNSTPNIISTVSQVELAPGDTFTVVIASKEMTVSSFICGVRFDTSKLEVTERKTASFLLAYDAEEDEDD